MRKLTLKNNDSNTVQTFWVGTGSLLSFVFGLLSSVALTRFLPKDEYGTYQQVLYVYTTLLTIFTLGLPKTFSYFLPRVSKAEGKSVALRINYILIAVGLLFSLFLYLLAPVIAGVLDNELLTRALRLFSPVPLLLLPTMGMEGLYATYRKTHISAIYMVMTRIFVFSCVVSAVVLFGGDHTDAIKGFVGASALQFLLAMALEARLFKGVKAEESAVSYKDIASFSIPLMLASLWGWVISSADQFFISRYFGKEVFAEYANGALQLPFVTMIIGATSTVLIPVLSKKIHEKEDFRKTMLPTIRNVFTRTAMLTYPLIFLCWFFAPEIIRFFYGEAYQSSAIYFRIVLVSNLFMLVTTGPVIIAMGANRYYAKVHMYGAIILIALEYACIIIVNSPYALVAISVICHIGRIMAMFIFIMRAFKVHFRDFVPWKLLLELSVPSIIMLLFIKHILGFAESLSNIAVIAIGFTTYALLFLLWVIFRKIDYLSIIKPLTGKSHKK